MKVQQIKKERKKETKMEVKMRKILKIIFSLKAFPFLNFGVNDNSFLFSRNTPAKYACIYYRRMGVRFQPMKNHFCSNCSVCLVKIDF